MKKYNMLLVLFIIVGGLVFVKYNTKLEWIVNKRSIVDVTKYGAKGDGITDDTIAFQKALNALRNGQTFLVPKSKFKYRISRIDIKDKRNCKFIFKGRLKFIDGANDYDVLSFWSGNYNCDVEGLYLDGNSHNSIDNGIIGGRYSLVIGKNQSNLRFKNVVLVNSLYCGILTGENLLNCSFENLKFYNTGEHCIYISGGGCKNLSFKNIYAESIGVNKNMDPAHESAIFKIKSLSSVINTNFMFQDIELYRMGMENSTYSVVFILSEINGIEAKNIITKGTNSVVINICENVKNVNLYKVDSNCLVYNSPLAENIYNINLNDSKLKNIVCNGINVFHSINNCTFDNPWIRCIDKPNLKNSTTFNNCEFINVSRPNAMLFDYIRNDFNFNNCKFSSSNEVKYNQGIIIFKNTRDSILGKITFLDCEISSNWYYACIQIFNDFSLSFTNCTLSNGIINYSKTRNANIVFNNTRILYNSTKSDERNIEKFLFVK